MGLALSDACLHAVCNCWQLFTYYDCCWALLPGNLPGEDGGSGEGEPLIQLDFQAWLRVAIEQ
eukprot:COSAG01_NODE_3332_length_6235_cov_3.027678_2_plen_63_part_00